jgi:hypothetical protein
MFGIEIIANGLIIKIFVPVNVHGAGNMPGVIKRDIFVALNDADLGIVQMLDDPFRSMSRRMPSIRYCQRCVM